MVGRYSRCSSCQTLLAVTAAAYQTSSTALRPCGSTRARCPLPQGGQRLLRHLHLNRLPVLHAQCEPLLLMVHLINSGVNGLLGARGSLRCLLRPRSAAPGRPRAAPTRARACLIASGSGGTGSLAARATLRLLREDEGYRHADDGKGPHDGCAQFLQHVRLSSRDASFCLPPDFAPRLHGLRRCHPLPRACQAPRLERAILIPCAAVTQSIPPVRGHEEHEARA